MNKTTDIRLKDISETETIAARLVIWWQLGMPAVASEFLNYNRGRIHTKGMALNAIEIVNDGRIALLSMAGTAAAHLGRYEDGELRCILKHSYTCAELKNPKRYGQHNPCDFDWAISTGLKISGKINNVRECVQDRNKIASFIFEKYSCIQWTCLAYYLLAYIILMGNWSKTIITTELIRQKGTLLKKEVNTLFEGWGAPTILDLSMKRIENLIGKCPVKIDTNTFDLITYGISELKRNDAEKSTSSHTTKEKQ